MIRNRKPSPSTPTTLLLLLVFGFFLFTPSLQAEEMDADMMELQRQAEQMRVNYEKLNQSNPLMQHAPNQQTLQNLPGANLPGNIKPDEAFEKINKIMNNPVMQGYMKVFSNPILVTQLEEVLKSKNKQNIFFAEACLFIIFLIIRAWLAVKVRFWFLAFILRLIVNLGYFAVCSIGIPLIFIGEPYQKILMTLFQSLKGLF